MAAQAKHKFGIGIDISGDYLDLCKIRLSQGALYRNEAGYRLIKDSARNLRAHVDPESVDFCFTSPPYWNILNQKRSADNKEIRNYGNAIADCERAVALDSNSTIANNNLAWLLSIAPDVKLRDGSKALEYAKRACKLTNWQDAR